MGHSALGAHVFAGGFTGGVAKVMPVVGQLETHGLGNRTSEQVWGVPTYNCPAGAKAWPRIEASLIFGNPRCTAFSCVTSGYGANARGPTARACQDIHDLMEYALGHYPCIVWESVQQAYTVGRPIIEDLERRCVAAGMRVAHLFVNACTFGNPQNRKRYFFVAYPRERQFNVSLPTISPFYPVLCDAIWHLRDRVTHAVKTHLNEDHPPDAYLQVTPDEEACIPHLPGGACLNNFGRWMYDYLPPKFKLLWDTRTSDMPFSMHTLYRCNWLRPSPTLKGTSGRLVHPWHDRTLTVSELSAIMGWHWDGVERVPLGGNPCAQLAKGVCPVVGEWLAQQVVACLDDVWGGEDYESTYDHKVGQFVGRDTRGEDVKTFNLTDYRGWNFDLERHPREAFEQHRKFNVDPLTGELRKRWDLIQPRS